MTFINERLGKQLSDGWRTIDYERDAYLVSKGTCHGRESYSGGREFELIYKGTTTTFAAYMDMEMVGSQANVHWELFQLKIPNSLQPQKNDVIRLIEEALDAFGVFYDRSSVFEVTIDSSQFV